MAQINSDDFFLKDRKYENLNSQGSLSEDVDGLSASSLVVSKKGSRKLPEQWTRVISLSHDNVQNLRTFSIDTDLLMVSEIENEAEPIQSILEEQNAKKKWQLIFCPKEFGDNHTDISLEHYQLGEKRMKRYGEQISDLRKIIMEKALAAENNLPEALGDDLRTVKSITKRMSRWENEGRRFKD